LVSDEDQIPQVMGITQGVDDVSVPEVRTISVVHGFPFEGREDANRIQGFAATLLVDCIIRQQRRAGHVHPPELAVNPIACLIKVTGIFCLDQCGFRQLVHRLHLPGRLIADFHDRAFADRLLIQVFDDLCRSLQGHKMVLVEVHHLRFVLPDETALDILKILLNRLDELGLHDFRVLYLDKGFAAIKIIDHLKERKQPAIIACQIRCKTGVLGPCVGVARVIAPIASLPMALQQTSS